MGNINVVTLVVNFLGQLPLLVIGVRGILGGVAGSGDLADVAYIVIAVAQCEGTKIGTTGSLAVGNGGNLSGSPAAEANIPVGIILPEIVVIAPRQTFQCIVFKGDG